MEAQATQTEYTGLPNYETPNERPRRGPGRPRKPLQAFEDDGDTIEESLEEKVNALIEEMGPTGEITAKICRKTANGFEMIGQIDDIGPDNPLEQDAIGKTYGGGRYRIYFHVNGKMVRTIRFSLGREYDRYLSPQAIESKMVADNAPRLGELVHTLKEMQTLVKNPPPVEQRPMDWEKLMAVAIPAMGAVAGLIKSMVEPIADAIRDSGKGRNENGIEKFLPLLLEQTRAKNENAMIAFKEGIALARESINPAPAGKDPVEWQDIVMEMVKQAPLVLQPMFQTLGLRGLLAHYPQAKTVLENPEALQAFKDQLTAEHGADQASKILQTVGLDKQSLPLTPNMVKL